MEGGAGRLGRAGGTCEGATAELRVQLQCLPSLEGTEIPQTESPGNPSSSLATPELGV